MSTDLLTSLTIDLKGDAKAQLDALVKQMAALRTTGGGAVAPIAPEFRRMREETERAGLSVGGLRGALASLGAGLSVAGAVAFVGAVRSELDSAAKAARSLGVEFEKFRGLDYAFKAQGADAGAFAAALGSVSKTLNKAAEDSITAADAYKTLGLAQEELARSPLDESILKIIERLQEVPAGATRNQLAFATLGGSAERLKSVIDGGAEALRELAGEMKELDPTTEATARAAEELGDNWEKLKVSLKGLVSDSGIMEGLAKLSGFSASFLQNMRGANDVSLESLKAQITDTEARLKSLNANAFGLGGVSDASALSSKLRDLKAAAAARGDDSMNDVEATRAKALQDKLDAEKTKKVADDLAAARAKGEAARAAEEAAKAAAKEAAQITQKFLDETASLRKARLGETIEGINQQLAEEIAAAEKAGLSAKELADFKMEIEADAAGKIKDIRDKEWEEQEKRDAEIMAFSDKAAEDELKRIKERANAELAALEGAAGVEDARAELRSRRRDGQFDLGAITATQAATAAFNEETAALARQVSLIQAKIGLEKELKLTTEEMNALNAEKAIVEEQAAAATEVHAQAMLRLGDGAESTMAGWKAGMADFTRSMGTDFERARRHANELSSELSAGLGDVVKSLATDWENAGDAIIGVLGRISDKLLDMALENLMADALGGLGSVFGGFGRTGAERGLSRMIGAGDPTGGGPVVDPSALFSGAGAKGASAAPTVINHYHVSAADSHDVARCFSRKEAQDAMKANQRKNLMGDVGVRQAARGR